MASNADMASRRMEIVEKGMPGEQISPFIEYLQVMD
jgi:hypothetical protein